MKINFKSNLTKAEVDQNKKLFNDIARKINDCKDKRKLPEIIYFFVLEKLSEKNSQAITQAVEEERKKCREIFIENVDWAEWAISDEEAGEDFDNYRTELDKLTK